MLRSSKVNAEPAPRHVAVPANDLIMGMEDDTKAFLVRIMQTISEVLLWMLVNVFIGIYKDYAFFEDHPNWTNYLFYTFFLISLVILLVHLKRKWKL